MADAVSEIARIQSATGDPWCVLALPPPVPQPDPYEPLSDPDEVARVRVAFKKIALIVHPDRCSVAECGKVFQTVSAARDDILHGAKRPRGSRAAAPEKAPATCRRGARSRAARRKLVKRLHQREKECLKAVFRADRQVGRMRDAQRDLTIELEAAQRRLVREVFDAYKVAPGLSLAARYGVARIDARRLGAPQHANLLQWCLAGTDETRTLRLVDELRRCTADVTNRRGGWGVWMRRWPRGHDAGRQYTVPRNALHVLHANRLNVRQVRYALSNARRSLEGAEKARQRARGDLEAATQAVDREVEGGV